MTMLGTLRNSIVVAALAFGAGCDQPPAAQVADKSVTTAAEPSAELKQLHADLQLVSKDEVRGVLKNHPHLEAIRSELQSRLGNSSRPATTTTQGPAPEARTICDVLWDDLDSSNGVDEFNDIVDFLIHFRCL